MADPMLGVFDLEIRYGRVPAVRGLSLEVGAGEVVGLIGSNGAGKSTTLLGIMGVERPSGGDVRLAGESLLGEAPDVIARRGVALVPEGRHVFPDFTVEENLRLGLLGRSTDQGAADDLEWVSSLFPVVSDFSRRLGGQLSGGQQQQLAIARALVGAPRVLLLDEPSLGLAPSVVDTLFDAIAEIRDRGVAVLLVEQRAQLTVAFADRTHVLRNGELVLTLTPADATDTNRMTRAYFGQ
jgi:branched-chain amino acid transport system ATP-binding protein